MNIIFNFKSVTNLLICCFAKCSANCALLQQLPTEFVIILSQICRYVILLSQLTHSVAFLFLSHLEMSDIHHQNEQIQKDVLETELKQAKLKDMQDAVNWHASDIIKTTKTSTKYHQIIGGLTKI